MYNNSNRLLLLGRSLGEERMRRITDLVRADPVVEEVYRAKSEELGAGTYRFAAEIEFSGTKVVERYLDQGDGAKREALHEMFRAAGADDDPRAMDAALKLYGEEVVTAVGDEVDRIEKAIVREEPSIHYVDLETN
jgi:zinc transporter 9